MVIRFYVEKSQYQSWSTVAMINTTKNIVLVRVFKFWNLNTLIINRFKLVV